MPTFSERSKTYLATCDERLQRLMHEVIKIADCTVLVGHRIKEDQDEAVRTGASKASWPMSKHNSQPSKAVDVAPFPISWPDLSATLKRVKAGDLAAVDEYARDLGRWYMFIGLVRGTALQMGIKVRCGADWDGDMEVKDQNFHDLPHIELED